MTSHLSGFDEALESMVSSLFERARRSDPGAWDRIVDLYGPLIYWWCRNAGVSEAATAAIGQDVFDEIANNLDRMNTRAAMPTFRDWVRQITQARMEGRPIPRDHSAHLVSSEPTAGVEPSISASEEVLILYQQARAIADAGLTATDWRAYELFVSGNHAVNDIAGELGISCSQVYLSKSRVTRGLRGEVADGGAMECLDRQTPPRNQCLSREEMEAFDRGLALEAEEDFAAHLADCETCAASFGQVTERLGFVPTGKDPCSQYRGESPLSEMLARARLLHPTRLSVNGRAHTEGWTEDWTDGGTVDTNRTESAVTMDYGGSSDPNYEERLRIGGYPLLGKLGAGGFADVYKAKDPQSNRFVAIKVLRADKVSEPTSKSLIEEAKVAANLDHPSIVKVFDWGRDEEGVAYVVLDYVSGMTLRERMKRGPLDFANSAQVIREVANALDFAHRSNVFHRDVKPDNILLDEEGRALLNDFGLAIREEHRWEHDGKVAGTLAYMAPEQLEGDAARYDVRTDIWGVGVMFYEMLTGRRPFAGTAQQMASEIRTKQPRHPRSFDANIPDELCAICLGCLEKDVKDRLASAWDVADKVREWQELPRRRATRRRRQLLRGLGVALVIATVAAPLYFRSGEPNGQAANSSGAPASVSHSVSRWESLLEEAPEVLVWLPGPSSSHGFGDNGLVIANAIEDSLFSCREIDGERFLLRLRLRVDEQVGCGGLIFAIDEASPGQFKATGLAIGNWAPGREQLLSFVTLSLQRLADGRFIATGRNIDYLGKDVPAPRGDATIELEMRDGVLHSASLFDSKGLVGTFDKFPDSRKSSGRVGLYAFGDTVIFYDFQVKQLQPKSTTESDAP